VLKVVLNCHSIKNSTYDDLVWFRCKLVEGSILLASKGSIVHVRLIVCGKGKLKYRRPDSTILIELSNLLVTLGWQLMVTK
jgi:hypothetical protein